MGVRERIKMMVFRGIDLGVVDVCEKREMGFLRILSTLSTLFWVW